MNSSASPHQFCRKRIDGTGRFQAEQIGLIPVVLETLNNFRASIMRGTDTFFQGATWKNFRGHPKVRQLHFPIGIPDHIFQLDVAPKTPAGTAASTHKFTRKIIVSTAQQSSCRAHRNRPDHTEPTAATNDVRSFTAPQTLKTGVTKRKGLVCSPTNILKTGAHSNRQHTQRQTPYHRPSVH